MNKEAGIVTKLVNGKALVESEANVACFSCASKHSCVTFSGTKKRKVWLQNDLNLQVGDTVLYSIEERGIIFASILLYFLPVILLIAGIVVGSYFSQFNIEIASMIGGFIGFLISLFLIKFVSELVKDKVMFKPQLLEKCINESEIEHLKETVI